ncbi:hypothetical protein CHELA20_54267 [Hyphomicrobiales bacterium]|nr:hypothetical protein CHELA20_54267 [Hyphomicrobiales bacterium]
MGLRRFLACVLDIGLGILWLEILKLKCGSMRHALWITRSFRENRRRLKSGRSHLRFRQSAP